MLGSREIIAFLNLLDRDEISWKDNGALISTSCGGGIRIKYSTAKTLKINHAVYNKMAMVVQNEPLQKILLLACSIPAFTQMLSFLDSPMNWTHSSCFARHQVPELDIKLSTIFDVEPKDFF